MQELNQITDAYRTSCRIYPCIHQEFEIVAPSYNPTDMKTLHHC